MAANCLAEGREEEVSTPVSATSSSSSIICINGQIYHVKPTTKPIEKKQSLEFSNTIGSSFVPTPDQQSILERAQSRRPKRTTPEIVVPPPSSSSSSSSSSPSISSLFETPKLTPEERKRLKREKELKVRRKKISIYKTKKHRTQTSYDFADENTTIDPDPWVYTQDPMTEELERLKMPGETKADKANCFACIYEDRKGGTLSYEHWNKILEIFKEGLIESANLPVIIDQIHKVFTMTIEEELITTTGYVPTLDKVLWTPYSIAIHFLEHHSVPSFRLWYLQKSMQYVTNAIFSDGLYQENVVTGRRRVAMPDLKVLKEAVNIELSIMQKDPTRLLFATPATHIDSSKGVKLTNRVMDTAKSVDLFHQRKWKS